MIKIAIVDDQPIIRDGLKMMLSLDKDIEILYEASSAEELFIQLEDQLPNIILMDIRMPKVDGVEATKIIKAKYPIVKVIILTTFNEDEYIFKGLKNGADGYLLKDADSYSLISAINTVYNGNMLLHPDIANKVINSFKSNNTYETGESPKINLSSLTSRETEIAYLIKDGKSNKEISTLLFITEGTVKNHITNILSKLELTSRAKLTSFLNKH